MTQPKTKNTITNTAAVINSLPTPHSHRPIPLSDYDQITALFTTYTTALRAGSIPLLSSTFHPSATMYGFNLTGTLFGGPISNLYAFIELHGPAPHVRVRTDVIWITATTAVVKVEIERDGAGFGYTDFCSLVKLDGKWKIVGKTFHMYAP